MYRIEHTIKTTSKQIEIIPFGDIHYSSPNCKLQAFLDIVKYIKDTPDTYAIGMGDYIDCYDKDTQLLTSEGFKYYWELKNNETVLTYNSNENIYEYQIIDKLIIKKYSGDMFHFLGSKVDLLVTPNHRILYKHYNSRKSNWSRKIVKKAKDFSPNTKKKSIWKFLNSIGRFNTKQTSYNNDFIKLCGWLITEGWVEKRGNSIRYSISQSLKANPLYVKEIDIILKELKYKYSKSVKKDGVVIWRISSKNNLLKELFGLDIHSIPRIILNSKFEDLQILYDTLIKGDGHINKRNTVTFPTVHNKLKDGFQELCFKLGLSYSVRTKKTEGKDIHIFYIGTSGQGGVGIKELNKEKHDGVVWCVSVKNTFIVVRRNNKTIISGNCVMPKDKRFEITNSDDYIDNHVTTMCSMLEPIKDKIICLLTGNHEYKIHTEGYGDPTKRLCRELGIKYAGFSAFIRIGVLPRSHKGRLVIYAHHGWSAGRKTGSNINNIENLAQYWDADVYLVGHSHRLFATRQVRIGWNGQRKLIFGNTGSFLETCTWNTTGYGERAGFPPVKLGCLKIKYFPYKPDIHVSE